jgi:predicted permease
VSWLARLRRRRDLERELDAELREHVERRTADFVRAGDSPAVARRRAAAEFGGLEPIKEQCRDVRRWRLLDDLVQDVQYAGRGLRAHPVVSAAIVLSLALGIGANTAVFTVLYATLIRPLPVDDPQSLVQFVPYTASGDQSSHLSYPLFRELSAATSAGIDMFAVAGPKMPRLKIGGGFPERAVVEDVSWNYFRALRVPPAAGRVLQEGDDSISGGSAVAVLSHSFWERRFDASADAIGRTIEIDGKPFVVVGVAAGGFDGTEAESRTEIWLPITSRLQPAWLSMTGSMIMRLMGRLAPAADRHQLEAAADVTYRRHLAEHFLKGVPPNAKSVWRNRGMRLRSAGAGLSSLGLGYRQPLLILMAAVAIILVLACANVANLLLARHRAREREFAVRLSLGAGRSRLARQLLTESVFVAALGALGGVLLAWWGARALIGLLPQPAVAFAFDLSPNPATLLFSMALAGASAVTVGAMPALRAARTPSTALVRTSRTVLHLRFGKGLVVLQIAGSLALLVAAGLMVRTLQNLKATDLGFAPDGVTTFDFSFPTDFPAANKAPLYSRMIDRLQSMPGVRGATYSQESVYNVGGWSGRASGPAAEDVPADARDVALLRVGPRFFEVLDLRLLTGRTFEPGDHSGQARSILVNETFARHFFKGDSPLGRTIGLNKSEFEIVGVVKDALHYGAREQPCGGRVAYFPIDVAAPGGAFFVRGNAPVADIGQLAAEEARQTDSEILVSRLRPLEVDVERLIAQERLVGMLATGFAVLALSLAAVGLYGIMSYGVTQRTGEIGVRAALGASPGVLRRMVLADSCRLVIAGLALGGIAAFFGTRLVTSLLFGVQPADPVTIAVAPLTLALVATGAAYLPARRAARIDPAVALRMD